LSALSITLASQVPSAMYRGPMSLIMPFSMHSPFHTHQSPPRTPFWRTYLVIPSCPLGDLVSSGSVGAHSTASAMVPVPLVLLHGPQQCSSRSSHVMDAIGKSSRVILTRGTSSGSLMVTIYKHSIRKWFSRYCNYLLYTRSMTRKSGLVSVGLYGRSAHEPRRGAAVIISDILMTFEFSF